MARVIEYSKIGLFSVTVYLSGLDREYKDDDREIKWSIYDEDRNLVDITSFEDLDGGISRTPSVTFNDLTPNTKYLIYYYIRKNYDSLASDEDWFYTDAIEPYITNVNTNHGKEDVRIYWGCNDDYSGVTYEIYVRQKNTTRWYLKKSTSYVPSSYTSISVDQYNVTYQVKVVAFYDGIEQEDSGITNFSVTVTAPDAWQWTSSELNALQNHGSMSTITGTRWNSFISWLNDVIGYRAAVDDEDYDQISNSSKLTSDKILYADAWNNIDYCSRVAAGSYHTDVDTGDIIYGSYITSLTNIMNNLL